MPSLNRFSYESYKEDEPRGWLIVCKTTGETMLRKVLPPKLNENYDYVALTEGFRISSDEIRKHNIGSQIRAQNGSNK